MPTLFWVPGRKSGTRGERRNTYGRELKALRDARGVTIQTLISKLQVKGWDIGEDTITNIEMGRRILSDTELTLILIALKADLTDLNWPPK